MDVLGGLRSEAEVLSGGAVKRSNSTAVALKKKRKPHSEACIKVVRLLTFPDGFTGIHIHRRGAILGQFDLAEQQTGFSHPNETAQLSVGILNHADLLHYKTLLLELSSYI
jgi:hypothetical protein